MVSTRTSIISAAVALSATIARVRGHGYMLVPESQFKDSTTSAWVVQIEPQWASDSWDGNNQGSVDTYKSLAAEKGVTEIRSLLDDTSIYGQDCGFTDPDGTAQDIPTDGKATFSRGMVHVGPCEIWLDDTMVLHDDDCYSTYGGDDQDVKSVFPVDYSSCNSGGCKEMRFYWLAFQGVDGDTVWQVYKNCIPLKGSSSTSTTSESTANESDEETTEAPESESNDEGDESKSKSKESDDDDDNDNDSDNDNDDNSEESKASESKSDDSESNSEWTPEPATTEATSSNSNSNSTSSSTTTSTTTTTSGSVPDGTWPTSQGTVEYDEVYTVAAGETFDGGMKTYQRSDITCEGQTESGGSTAVFQVEAGGTLKNVIIGANQMEGVHCDDHDCTIENVWWDDVCEDALSIKGGSASSVSTVTGGGARSADDKVVQHNGYGTVKIDGFYAEDFGKLYRSCGTCGDKQRFVSVSNVYAVNPGKSIVTVNDNYGDEATLSNIYIKADDDGYDVCAWSQASEDGEPEELGAGIKDPLCQYSESDIHIV